MSAKVHIWDAVNTEVGHASISLSNGIHISWWPSGDIAVKDAVKNRATSPAIPDVTFAKDKEFKDGKPPKTYEVKLTSDQLEKITNWWVKFKETYTNWDLYSMNCSTVVYLALDAAFPRVFTQPNGPWMPSTIEKMVKDLINGVPHNFVDTSVD